MLGSLFSVRLAERPCRTVAPVLKSCPTKSTDDHIIRTGSGLPADSAIRASEDVNHSRVFVDVKIEGAAENVSRHRF